MYGLNSSNTTILLKSISNPTLEIQSDAFRFIPSLKGGVVQDVDAGASKLGALVSEEVETKAGALASVEELAEGVRMVGALASVAATKVVVSVMEVVATVSGEGVLEVVATMAGALVPEEVETKAGALVSEKVATMLEELAEGLRKVGALVAAAPKLVVSVMEVVAMKVVVWVSMVRMEVV